MEKDTRQQLEQINENLKAIALNQAAVWAEIERIEARISGTEKAGSPEISRT